MGYPVWSNSPFGIVGPAGMKPEVVKKLDTAFRNALKDPKLLAVTQQYGMSTNYMGPEQYTAYAQKAFKSEGGDHPAAGRGHEEPVRVHSAFIRRRRGRVRAAASAATRSACAAATADR
ncbi:tripartite tricarboxylate transporter substrate-binding protein [Cupriavidus sp. H18C1]|uniref:tripartite tricarboxylate transporter substrate-binding protein n=1 Tax=Cupriavidus sp. H18C1 TaxID=3241601 RepID=UPI003BB862DD